MFTPFIIPVHFEDLAVRARQRVRSGEEDEKRAKYVRFSVTPDLYDLADQLSVSEAVRVASSEVALEAEDLEALGDTGGAEWRNGWWLAHATASGLEQFQALYWCVHHWASLDTALARGQVASRVATGMRHVAAMAEATDAEGSDAPALMLSAGRLAAFVGAFLVQVMEQSLEDSVVPTGLTTPAPRPAAHPRPRRQKQRAARRPTSASDSSDVDDGDEENGDSPVDEMLLACADFDWSASEQREAFLEQFARLIESSAVLRAMFGRNAAEEAYVNLFCRAAYRLMESATTCKDKRVRAVVTRLLGVGVQRHGQAVSASTALVQVLLRQELAAVPLVEMLQALTDASDEQGGRRFAQELVRQVGRLNAADLAKDLAGAKSVAAFVMELSDRLPQWTQRHIGVLLEQLDGESYAVRNGVVHAIGRVLQHLASSTDDAETRDALTHILLERLADVSSFTRARTLQTWNALCEARVLPLQLFPTLARQVASRTHDRSSHVRRAAIQLMHALVRHNPYGARLEANAFRAKLEEHQRASEMPETELDSETTARNAAVFYASAVDFAEAIDEALATAAPPLLRSRFVTDVIETVALLVAASRLQVRSAADAHRPMLLLVMSREAAVKEAALNALEELLLRAPYEAWVARTRAQSNSGQLPTHAAGVVQVVRGLVQLVAAATVGEVACLDEWMQALVRTERVPAAVVQCLWDTLADRVPGTTLAMRRGAAFLIQSVARVQALAPWQLAQLETVGLDDAVMARWCCDALRCGTDERWPPDHPWVGRLESVVLGEGEAAAATALAALYARCTHPGAVAARLLQRLVQRLGGAETTVSAAAARRLLQVGGAIALQQLAYAESQAHRLRRQYRQQRRGPSGEAIDADTAQAQAAPEARPGRRGRRPTAAASSDHDDDDLVASTGAASATALDADLDALLKEVEAELVSPDALLGGLVLPLAAHWALDSTAPSSLQSMALLCLTRFMCISEALAAQYLPHVFTCLAAADTSAAAAAVARANAVVALSDLAFRFPNLLEPWTRHLYAALRDQDTRVRRNALMALTHLVLNDMIKVKGQVAELALCLEDADGRVVDLARTLFYDLSRKGGPSGASAVYQLLPDMISCLTRRPPSECGTEAFRRIARFVLSFIERERHTEALVDKLCQRMRTAPTAADARNLAYCLTLLNYTGERTVRRLSDLWKCYAEWAARDAEVRQHLLMVLGKARKFCKPTTKVVLDEWEARLQQLGKPAEEPEGAEAAGEPSATPAADSLMTPTADIDPELEAMRHKVETLRLRTPATVRQAALARVRQLTADARSASRGNGNGKENSIRRRRRRRGGGGGGKENRGDVVSSHPYRRRPRRQASMHEEDPEDQAPIRTAPRTRRKLVVDATSESDVNDDDDDDEEEEEEEEEEEAVSRSPSPSPPRTRRALRPVH